MGLESVEPLRHHRLTDDEYFGLNRLLQQAIKPYDPLTGYIYHQWASTPIYDALVAQYGIDPASDTKALVRSMQRYVLERYSVPWSESGISWYQGPS